MTFSNGILSSYLKTFISGVFALYCKKTKKKRTYNRIKEPTINITVNISYWFYESIIKINNSIMYLPLSNSFTKSRYVEYNFP